MKFLFALALLLPAIASADKYPDRECLDADQIKTLQKSFTVNLQQKINLCDTKTRTYNLWEGLLFIYNLSLDSSVNVPTPYNQKNLGKNWIQQIWKHGNTILWGPTYPGNSCATAYAFADVNTRQANNPFNGGVPADFFTGGRQNNFFNGANSRPAANYFPPATYGLRADTLYICPKLIEDAKDGSSVLTMVETLLHESRHLEGAATNRGYQHTNCKGQPKGTQGCDPSAQYRGAYATSMESHAKIGLQGFLVHPALRYYSKRMAYVEAQDRFVKPAVVYDPGSEVFLVEDTEGEFYFVNLKNEAQQVLKNSAYYDDVYRAEDMELAFIYKGPPARIQPMARYYIVDQQDPDEPWDSAIQNNVFFKRFKTGTTEQRNSFGGVALGSANLSSLTASIWGDTLLVESNSLIGKDIQPQEIKLPDGGPWRFRFFVGENKSASPSGIYVTNAKDALYSLEHGDKDELNWAPIANDFPGARQVINMKDVVYFVSKDGQLMRRYPSGDVAVKALAGKTIRAVTTSFFHHSDLPKELY